MGRPRWRAEIRGEKEELEALCRLFAAGPVQVLRDGDPYFLTARDVDSLQDAGAVRDRFAVWLTRLNAAGFLKFNGFRLASLGAVFETAPGGGDNITVSPGPAILVLATPALRSFLDLHPNRPPMIGGPVPIRVAELPPVEKWIGVADRSPDVDVALRNLIASPNDWRQLYYVYEVVEDDVGQPSQMAQLGLVSPEDIRRFKATANSRAVLGDVARHGRVEQAPERPMTIREARTFVVSLLAAWLRWKSEATPVVEEGDRDGT